MKCYINKNKEIFGFESNCSQDELITSDMIEISLEEIQAINQAKEDSYKASPEYKIQEAKAYLSDTDWYITRKFETAIEVPVEVIQKRSEARVLINSLEV